MKVRNHFGNEAKSSHWLRLGCGRSKRNTWWELEEQTVGVMPTVGELVELRLVSLSNHGW